MGQVDVEEDLPPDPPRLRCAMAASMEVGVEEGRHSGVHIEGVTGVKDKRCRGGITNVEDRQCKVGAIGMEAGSSGPAVWRRLDTKEGRRFGVATR